MLKHIRTFFFPYQTIFLYNVSKELVIEKLDGIFNRKLTFFDSNNLLGEFTNRETFEIWMKSAAYKTGLIGNSSMVGEVTELKSGQIQIVLKAKPNRRLYSMFFVFMVFSLVYLFNAIHDGSIKLFLLSGFLLIGGPILCIGVSNIQIQAIKDNYLKYIDKNL